MLQDIIELIVVLIIFLGVLGASYFVTKKLATFNRKMGANKNMEIIEVLPLMQGQYLYIVKVTNRYFVIGCSQKGNITYINEIEESELILNKESAVSFQEQFMHIMKGKQVKEDENKE